MLLFWPWRVWDALGEMGQRLFFVSEIRGGHVELHGEEAHHLTRVLRVQTGEQMELSDSRQLVLAEVAEISKHHVRFRVVEERVAPPPVARVDLVAGIFKFDHFEWMLEKAVELGASHVCPVFAEFTDRGLIAAAPKRRDRWMRIVKEASQQCRRWQLPALEEAHPLSRQLEREGRRLMLDESGGTPLLAALRDWGQGETVSLLTGPEGGWSPAERDAAVQAGWMRVSLGPTILRAETAAIAGLATVLQTALAR